MKESMQVEEFSAGASGKESICQYRRHKRHWFDLWVGKIPWRGHDNPLQYSRLENPMDRGAWWITVHWVAESQTQLKRLCTHTPGNRYFSSVSHISPLLILPTTPKKSVLLYYYPLLLLIEGETEAQRN